ncbi:MAG: ferredoxin [Elusimicrobiota bacterium]
MKVKVDEDLCTGCELCVSTCSEVFEMQGDVAVANNNNDPVPEEMEDCAEEAADMCPVDAISVEE